MVWGKSVIYLLAITTSATTVWGQQSSNRDGAEFPPGERQIESGFFGSYINFPGFGFLPQFQGSFQGMIPFQSLFSSTPAPEQGVSSTTAASTNLRRKRSIDDDNADGIFSGDRADRRDDDDEEENEDGPQNRLFFSSLFSSRVVACNYTTQPGRTCASCRQVLTCFPSNVGKLRTCKKFFPYCNNGRCSFIPGAQCSTATTVAATTAAATTTAATTTTGGTTTT